MTTTTEKPIIPLTPIELDMLRILSTYGHMPRRKLFDILIARNTARKLDGDNVLAQIDNLIRRRKIGIVDLPLTETTTYESLFLCIRIHPVSAKLES